MYRVYVPDVPMRSSAREISKSLNTSDQHTIGCVDVSKEEYHEMTLAQWVQVVMLLCAMLQTLRAFGIM